MTIQKTQFHRTKFQKEAILHEETKLYLQGETQSNIAKIMKIGIVTVNKDLKEVRERWKRSTLIDIDERIGNELEKIDKLEFIYFDSFEKSKQLKITTTKKSVPIYKNLKGQLVVNIKGELEEF